jgi:hypothetical protein
MLGGHQRQPGCRGEEKKSLPLLGIKPQFPGYQICSLLKILGFYMENNIIQTIKHLYNFSNKPVTSSSSVLATQEFLIPFV